MSEASDDGAANSGSDFGAVKVEKEKKESKKGKRAKKVVKA